MITPEDIEKVYGRIRDMSNIYEAGKIETITLTTKSPDGREYIQSDWFLVFGYKSDNTVTLFEIRKTRNGGFTISCPTKEQVAYARTILPNVYALIDDYNKQNRDIEAFI